MKNRIVVNLNPYEMKILAYMAKERGWRRGDVARMGIREMYMKEFPSKAVRKLHAVPDPSEEAARAPDEKYRPTTGKSPEEYCRNLGGEVVETNGVKYCQFTEEGQIMKKLVALDKLPI